MLSFKNQQGKASLSFAGFFLLLLLSGCGLQSWTPPKQIPPAIDFVRAEQADTKTPTRSLEELPSIREMVREVSKPKTAEQAQQEFTTLGENWLYGHGVGRSIGNVGTGILFPPYAIYLLGNAGLSLAGFEQVSVTNFIPETPKYYLLKAYDGVTSVPGRLFAFLGDKKFRETTGSAKKAPSTQ